MERTNRLLMFDVVPRRLQRVEKGSVKLSRTELNSVGQPRGGAGALFKGSGTPQMRAPLPFPFFDDEECFFERKSFEDCNFPLMPPTSTPTEAPTNRNATFVPGDLIKSKFGLLLSRGLDVKLLAVTDMPVPYADGSKSDDKFHGDPDAGACFVDNNPENPEGWIYVNNAEKSSGVGGVGAMTFDRHGNLLDYKMVLDGTSNNCGGGRTPWNTWVSCEENDRDGQIYQVDPSGKRVSEVMTMGRDGGNWESFAFDVRDPSLLRFFATEDTEDGALRRFTPDNPDWDDPWNILHGPGKTDFLLLHPGETVFAGTFEWTDDLKDARKNAKKEYPSTEGIDVYGSQLYFVSKEYRALFILDLDNGTYTARTTSEGLFDGEPDQIVRIVRDSSSGGGSLLYYSEENGEYAGVHARDQLGRLFTIFEGTEYSDETTGVAFSPDGRFLYAAFQSSGVLFAFWREDGLPFDGRSLDVKYHVRESRKK